MYAFLGSEEGFRLALCTSLYHYHRTYHFSAYSHQYTHYSLTIRLIELILSCAAAGGIGVGTIYATPQSNARSYVILEFPRREPHLGICQNHTNPARVSRREMLTRQRQVVYRLIYRKTGRIYQRPTTDYLQFSRPFLQTS